MKTVGILPVLVTLANGYCGLLAIFKTADGTPRDLYTAAWLVLLAMVFDVADGKIARMAGTTSRFGAYLDSISDAISFGVAPAFLAKAISEHVWPGLPPKLITLLCALFALGAMLRLARYNVEHASPEGSDREGREVPTFDGLPTPGAAGFVAALVFLAYDDRALADYTVLLRALVFLCPLLGYLMVSRVRYVHFGHRFLRGRRDFAYLFVVVVLAVLVTKYPHESLAAGFIVYGVSGPALAPFRRRGEPALRPEER